MTVARAIPLALLALLPLAPFVAADAHGDCDSKGWPALGVVDFGWGYMDDRNYFFGNGIWWYLENNGLSGLQRGGASPFTPNDNEICQDDSENGPDLLWY